MARLFLIKVEDYLPYLEVQEVGNGPYVKESLHPRVANTWKKYISFYKNIEKQKISEKCLTCS